MASKHLATYLRDHLAGSVMALELLSHLKSAYSGTPVEHFAQHLLDEVDADRKMLEELMTRLQITPSQTRKASAWLGDKLAILKLRLDDPSAGGLRLLETCEAVSLGIEGKRSLWRALATASEQIAELRDVDYDRLIERAEEQRGKAEAVRLQAAQMAFT